MFLYHETNRNQETEESNVDTSAIRADLLVDCIRHTTNPQVQNAALLLISSLASWMPELVLHNLMPIFTFMGSTLLRQSDDYSAHVIDQVCLTYYILLFRSCVNFSYEWIDHCTSCSPAC